MTELADRSPRAPGSAPRSAPLTTTPAATTAAGRSGTQPSSPEAPAVDVAALGELLLGKWSDTRLKSRALAGRPELHKTEGLTHTEHRQRAFGQLKILVDNGAVHRAFPGILDRPAAPAPAGQGQPEGTPTA